MNKKILMVVLLSGISAATAFAQKLDITKSAGKKTVDFGGLQTTADGSAREFYNTVQAAVLQSGSIIKGGPDIAEYVISGTVRGGEAGVEARIQVFEKATRRPLLGESYEASAREVRRNAFKAADEIIEAITGKKGFASARLLMVGNKTKAKELYICDSDGRGLYQVTQDRKMIVGPRWGHDAKSIFYSSNLKTFVAIYKIDLATLKRTQMANFSGMNASPAVSPDGSTLAMVLSKDGNPELYVMNLSDRSLTRLTSTKRGNEASPSWSPDGREIVYVSDAPGTPQLFIISRNGGTARQITSRGRQNVAPDWGPHGEIVYSSLTGGKFQLVVFNPQTGVSRQLTSEHADHEDASWAPDGRHIAFAKTSGYNSKVYLIDTDGSAPLLLSTGTGDWYAPKWTR